MCVHAPAMLPSQPPMTMLVFPAFFVHPSSPHPPHSPPAGRQTAKSALESFAWIQQGLSVSLAGSKKMAPSNSATVQRNAGSGRSTAGEHRKETSSGHSIDCINQHQSLSTAAVRPQTARQHTPQEPLQVLQVYSLLSHI